MSDTDPDEYGRTSVELSRGDIVLSVDGLTVRLNEDEAEELADELRAAASRRRDQMLALLRVLEATVLTMRAAGDLP